ncbi:5'/3'-nucleotidase SurE [Phosphitispora fastidiosa]|uniref:5'/3'-nucleotidase SurE n=1 Tax=Phosphitispora fastidiosa TaxID=2837202 RepID=UPI001E442530|nr:5'/3'-nucleotidase SurE [Phosphitispora fastidiosa]MBU7005365.1 5'-nucleotidase [Phosphitispora fastidiosa]
MLILVSNDDGIQAPGINALRTTLEQLGDVYVVAPDRPRSASGLGITIHKPLRAEQVEFSGSSSKGYAVNGTPSDCVKLAIQALLPRRPDIVVAGINLGPNLGTDVLYSGTVSAALEGVINDVPSIAVSLASWESADFDFAAEFTRRLVEVVVCNGLPDEMLLNVNVPALKDGRKPAKVAVTRLGKRRYENTFEKRRDPRGKEYYWMGGEVMDIMAEPGTDIASVKNGEISVTPLCFDVTGNDFINMVREWNLGSIL